jgi:hypothetical protein
MFLTIVYVLQLMCLPYEFMCMSEIAEKTHFICLFTTTRGHSRIPRCRVAQRHGTAQRAQYSAKPRIHSQKPIGMWHCESTWRLVHCFQISDTEILALFVFLFLVCEGWHESDAEKKPTENSIYSCSGKAKIRESHSKFHSPLFAHVFNSFVSRSIAKAHL